MPAVAKPKARLRWLSGVARTKSVTATI